MPQPRTLGLKPGRTHSYTRLTHSTPTFDFDNAQALVADDCLTSSRLRSYSSIQVLSTLSNNEPRGGRHGKKDFVITNNYHSWVIKYGISFTSSFISASTRQSEEEGKGKQRCEVSPDSLHATSWFQPSGRLAIYIWLTLGGDQKYRQNLQVLKGPLLRRQQRRMSLKLCRSTIYSSGQHPLLN